MQPISVFEVVIWTQQSAFCFPMDCSEMHALLIMMYAHCADKTVVFPCKSLFLSKKHISKALHYYFAICCFWTHQTHDVYKHTIAFRLDDDRSDIHIINNIIRCKIVQNDDNMFTMATELIISLLIFHLIFSPTNLRNFFSVIYEYEYAYILFILMLIRWQPVTLSSETRLFSLWSYHFLSHKHTHTVNCDLISVIYFVAKSCSLRTNMYI